MSGRLTSVLEWIGVGLGFLLLVAIASVTLCLIAKPLANMVL